MAIINVLDKKTAELIAAGEVVERPASVVKELVENSIDAGAKNILVDIERGGIKKILVQDDGSGIDSEYIKTAFVRHATSKIKTGEDLDHIASLGFRGEALPSIAGVSHTTLISKTEEQDFAVEFKISGGEEESFEIKPFVTGSRFIIRDLFYNTPARMKFLKKDSTEAGYVQDIVTNLALSKPDISFTFVKDGTEVFSTVGDGNLLNTIASVFSTEYANTLTKVDYETEKFKITGYTTVPHGSRQSRNMQFSFVNSRYVKNKTIISAVENAYKGTVMSGKFPGYVINIRLPLDEVDVNVHPAKTEVRFSNEGDIFSAVYRAIKTAITSDVTLKQFSFKKQTAFDIPNDTPVQQIMTEQPKKTEDDDYTSPRKQEISYNTFNLSGSFDAKKTDRYMENYIKPQIERPAEAGDDIFHSEGAEYKTRADACSAENFADSGYKYDSFKISAANYKMEDKEPAAEVTPPVSAQEFYSDNLKVIGEVFSTYIICRTGDEIIVIDKHAAHERILYEQFKKNTIIDKQMLLVPVTVKLSRPEKQAVLENGELLESSGFEIEDFGGDAVIVRAIPMYVIDENPENLVSEIAYNLSNGNKSEMSEKMDWIFRSVACRSAIKGGDKAEINRITALVKDIRSKKIPLYCPHGRPIIITITKKELEKQFGR